MNYAIPRRPFSLLAWILDMKHQSTWGKHTFTFVYQKNSLISYYSSSVNRAYTIWTSGSSWILDLFCMVLELLLAFVLLLKFLYYTLKLLFLCSFLFGWIQFAAVWLVHFICSFLWSCCLEDSVLKKQSLPEIHTCSFLLHFHWECSSIHKPLRSVQLLKGYFQWSIEFLIYYTWE